MRLVAAVLFVAAATAAEPPAVDEALPFYVPVNDVHGEILSAGGDSMDSLMKEWGNSFKAYYPQTSLKLDHKIKLSADGFTELLEGRANLVPFVRELFPSERINFEKKFGYSPLLVTIAGGSYATKGGTHAIAIYVHATNPLRRITLAQLDAIFSASRKRGGQEIKTWGQLGLTGEWADRPIHLYGMLRHRETGNPPGIVNFLQHRMLLGGEFKDSLLEQKDSPGAVALDAIVHRVADDPSGIGFSGFANACSKAKTLEIAENESGPYYAGTQQEVATRHYPLSRQIYLCVNHPPSSELLPILREFLRFTLSREGQQAIASDREQFIPLSAELAAAERDKLN